MALLGRGEVETDEEVHSGEMAGALPLPGAAPGVSAVLGCNLSGLSARLRSGDPHPGLAESRDFWRR